MFCATTTPPITDEPTETMSAGDELAAIGFELNANQYRAVHLAARYDEELEWFHLGLPSAAAGIAARLQLHISTAHEWVRVGHALRHLPLTNAAFAANEISYAKARILTRWADADNEQQLLDLAMTHTANRLTTHIANALAVAETDEERDRRLHDARSVTTYTDGDGMVIIRAALPPEIAKPILGAIDDLVTQIAHTPLDTDGSSESSAADAAPPTVSEPVTQRDESRPRTSPSPPSLSPTLEDLRRRWQPDENDDWACPSLAQQRADALFVLLLLRDVGVTTEIVIHVRGDGSTFEDGTPITTNAVARQLDDSYVRLMLHEPGRGPVDATNRRRFPTTRQKRVVLERHNHQCVDCGRTDLIELDHNPAYRESGQTVTTELEPRCAPCHRARHRKPATPDRREHPVAA